MFRSILVAVDSSDASHNAVRRAGLLAAHFQARLILLQMLAPVGLKLPYKLFASALKTDFLVTRAQLALGRLAAQVTRDHDVHATAVVRVGNAFEQVADLVQEADLLVIGTKSRNPFHGCVFGTRTLRLVQLPSQPVLFVKTPATATYAQVLVPTDFTACSEASLRLALQLGTGTSVNVFHALSTHRETRMRVAQVPVNGILQYVTNSREKCLRRLDAMVIRSGGHGVQRSVGHGNPAFLCLERQKSLAADLIVMGTQGQRRPASDRALTGSLAQHLVANASCDILAIPCSALTKIDGRASVQRPYARVDGLAIQDRGNWIRRGAAPMYASGY